MGRRLRIRLPFLENPDGDEIVEGLTDLGFDSNHSIRDERPAPHLFANARRPPLPNIRRAISAADWPSCSSAAGGRGQATPLPFRALFLEGRLTAFVRAKALGAGQHTPGALATHLARRVVARDR